ncbi:MAG TPA: UDP-N-acetylglucosamine 1-carboxyvinyltransferase [Alphaproteobacteria bacterium]|nr:UDP-N-acetylglucosamine 1-carboxyvinyltransferase [Alphaproteobacteria bacterium]
MDKIRLVGNAPLKGTIRISGAKNAALPLLAACLLTDKKLDLHNVPSTLADVKYLIELLENLGVQSNESQKSSLSLQACNITTLEAPYEIVRKMRASILVLGPLLARFKKAKVSLPGGCAIGTRPVDLHIQGLKELGADIEIQEGYIHASAPNGLIGADVTLPLVTVTGTENLMMAATLAKGQTRLINAAREPEVIDLANCLNAMGAKITGAGTDTITIEGVSSLHGACHSVIPDRIETGSYAVAALITKGAITLTNTSLDLLPTFSKALEKAGGILTPTSDGFKVESNGVIHGVDVLTEPYPGYPTDLQAQMMSLMCLCEGASMITESIFENRFMHVPELCRMGANITVHGSSALIRGRESLSGAQVMATDLRASLSLVLSGLAANGETILSRVYHLDRGYEEVENKLRGCGADIERLKD